MIISVITEIYGDSLVEQKVFKDNCGCACENMISWLKDAALDCDLSYKKVKTMENDMRTELYYGNSEGITYYIEDYQLIYKEFEIKENFYG